jgi:hypothetical protein
VLQHLHVLVFIESACFSTRTTLLLGAFSPYLAFLRSNIDYDFTIEFAQPVIGRTTWLALDLTRRWKRLFVCFYRSGTIFFSRPRKFLNRLVRQIYRIVVVVANCKHLEKPKNQLRPLSHILLDAFPPPCLLRVAMAQLRPTSRWKVDAHQLPVTSCMMRVRHCPRTPPPTDEDVRALLHLVTICV